MSHLFFTERIENGVAFFDDHETRHLLVLRIEEKEEIRFTDGKGGIFKGTVYFKRKRFFANILEHTQMILDKNSSIVALGIAHSQWDREALLIEKATELGIQEFYFFPSRYSKYREINLQKVNFTIRKAIEQSQTPFFPQTHKVEDIQAFTNISAAFSKKVLLNPNAKKALFDERKSTQRILMLIGAEGGFHESETEFLMGLGFDTYHLGNRILRSETAAICGIVWALLVKDRDAP